jgi:hypothetical protein
VETPNIGTLDALADYTEPPFMRGAAKVGSEPFLTNAAERLDGRCGGPAA